MICPNCGTENAGESRYCVRCKIELRVSVATVDLPLQNPSASSTSFDSWVAELVDENLIDPIQSPAIQSATIADDDLWPTETVFVPTAETPDDDVAPLEARGVADLEFEDEEADDFFEQSLSGGIRRSDLDAEIETTEPDFLELDPPEPEIPQPEIEPTPEIPEPEPDSVPDIEPEPIPEPETAPEIPQPEIPIIEPPALAMAMPLLPQNEIREEPPQLQEPWIPVAGQVVVREIKVAPTGGRHVVKRKRRWGRAILRALGTLLFAALLFGAGLATGVWMLGVPESRIPGLNEAEVVAEKAPVNVPPKGMVFVPGGEFQMGSDTADVLSRPAHRASVGAFFMDVNEVTNAAYLEFVKATGHTPPLKWKDEVFPEGEGSFPVTGVSWYDAVEYAAWAGKRLPTEAEWEFAARGTDERLYPWGTEWNVESANAGGVSKSIRNVGEGGRSPFGLFDMSGNAWEWTKSDAKSYPGGKEFPWSKLKFKIIRGGNWQSGPNVATTVFRGFYGASGEREYDGTGFRCVKDVPKD